jgi:hypothetical protein
MPARAACERARVRIQSCALGLERLELEVLGCTRHCGPVFKEALAALAGKLQGARARAEALSEVGAVRAELLWRELLPVVEAIEDGLGDLQRLLVPLGSLASASGEELEAAYDEIARLERRFLVRLRHSAGEAVGEGYYRCCGCGAFNQPGAGFVLGRCARCGGNCHHQVSGAV